MAEQDATVGGCAVFDVCNTLYATNTTAGFVTFVHRSRSARRKALWVSLVRNRRSPLRYLLILLGRLLGQDLPRNLLIRTLAGITRDNLELLAQRYVDEELVGLRVTPVHAELERRRRSGYLVYLASSSLDVVIEAIAASLQADGFVASTLGFRDGVCTGALSRDLTGSKLAALGEMPIRGGEATLFVCSDNASDAPLFERAAEKMVVVNGGRMHAALDFEDAIYVHLD